ncbi:YidB family protein [Aquirhabdus sp.]|uniref:YidB family protein n=1 Tax=Aquirhabdus sp. TaxID=2824160 RepID=UPI00396C9A10
MGMLDGLVGQIAQQALAQGGQQGGLGGLLGGLLGGQQQQAGGGGLGGLLGGLLGGGQQPAQADGQSGGFSLGGNSPQLLAALLPLVLGWVQQQGGIGNVLSSLSNSGLGAQAQSWIGGGENHPVDPQAVGQVFGADQIAQVASQVGVSPEAVQNGLASLLPHVINQLTPNGDTSTAGAADNEIGAILGQLGGLFGK